MFLIHGQPKKTMKQLSRCVLSSVLLLPACFAQAQDNDEDELALVYGDKQSVSIATGNQQPIRRAPAVATVVTAQEIAAMGAVDLDEVLETVPGIHVNRAANFYGSLYVIRGIFSAYAPQTLMLQNGVPITTLYQSNKGNLWGGLPLENIARIEIIRGPGSALYGADAYSGVINVITKSASEIAGTSVGLRDGAFATRDAWVQHGGKLGPLDVAAYLRVGQTDGFREIVTADAQSRNDKAFGTHASLAPGSVNTGRDALDAGLDLALEKWRMRFGYKLRDNMGTGAGVASALDPVGSGKSERINSDLSWSDAQFARDWGAGLTASYLQYVQLIPTPLVLFPAGVTFPTGTFPNGMLGAPETWERQFRLSAFATYTGLAAHRMRLGLGHDDLNLYKTRELKNFSFTASGIPVPAGSLIDFTSIAPFLLPQRRKVNYLYAQDEWQFARDWTLTAGVRHDRYSDSGSTTNPRLAVVWEAGYDLTAKLLYGSAFRPPAFIEEYGANNPVARGNPNLRPETMKTLEAAFSWQTRKDIELNLNLFRYAMKDIIRTVPNAIVGTGSTYANTGDQNGHGIELEALWDVSKNLRLSGNYGYQRSIDEASGSDAGYAPHHHVYARADWRFMPDWSANTQFNWVADRARSAGDTRPTVPNYHTVDLTLRKGNGGAGRWDFAFSVRNLFDATVLEPSLAPGLIPNDLPQAGRAWYLQARYGF